MKLHWVVGIVAMLAVPALAPAQDNSSGGSKTSRDDGTDIVDIIERFSERTGKKIVIDSRVRAGVNLAGIDPGQVSWDELLAILDVNNFAAVDLNGLITIMPDANARQFPTPVYTDVNFRAADREIVSLMFEVKSACAPQIVPILRPMMPQAAHMAAFPQSNTLVLTDRAANVRRVAQMAAALDRVAPTGQKCKEMPPPKPKE